MACAVETLDVAALVGETRQKCSDSEQGLYTILKSIAFDLVLKGAACNGR